MARPKKEDGLTDKKAERIFCRRHAQEEREYYGPREAPMGTTLDASIDVLIGRGVARRTRPMRGCE